MLLIERLFKSQLRRNMVSGGVLSFANTLIGLFAYPIYLQYLGIDLYGIWLLLAVVLNFSRLGMLGIPSAMIKLISEYEDERNALRQEQYISTALILLFGVGLLIVSVTFILSKQIIILLGLTSDNSAIAITYLPYIVILSAYIFITETINSVLSGLGRMDKANYIMSLSRLVTLITSFSLLYNGLGIDSMLIANAVGYLYLHIASVRNINRLSPIRLFRLENCNKDAAARIIGFGGGVTGITLLNMFISPFNKIILSRYVSIEAVVVYEIGYRISNQLKSVYHTFFKALLPEVSKESAKKTKEANLRVRNINKRSFRLILITGLPSYLILFIVAEPLMKIWLGNGYIESMPNILRIFLVSSFFILLAIPSYFTLLGIGKINKSIHAAIIQSIINVFGILYCIWASITLNVYIVSCITVGGLILGSTYLMIRGRSII